MLFRSEVGSETVIHDLLRTVVETHLAIAKRHFPGPVLSSPRKTQKSKRNSPKRLRPRRLLDRAHDGVSTEEVPLRCCLELLLAVCLVALSPDVGRADERHAGRELEAGLAWKEVSICARAEGRKDELRVIL